MKNFCEKNHQYQCYLAGLYSAILKQVLFWIGSIRIDDIIFIWFWKKKTKNVINLKVNFSCDACRRSFHAILSLFSNLDRARTVWRQICLACDCNKWISHNSISCLVGFFPTNKCGFLLYCNRIPPPAQLRFINFTVLFRKSLGSCRNKPHLCDFSKSQSGGVGFFEGGGWGFLVGFSFFAFGPVIF